ncbi:unnamed protein product [Caenorhabditis nigoni]
MENENVKMRKELGSDSMKTSYKETIEELKAKIKEAKESKRKSENEEKTEINGISDNLAQKLKRKIREDYHLRKLLDSLKTTKEDNAELEEQVEQVEGNLNDKNVMEEKLKCFKNGFSEIEGIEKLNGITVGKKYEKMVEKLREIEGKQRKIENEMSTTLNKLERQKDLPSTSVPRQRN